MESMIQGLLRKPRWGPGTTLGSGICEGWVRPGLRQEPRVQRAQDCYPHARSHSPDLHPWPHRTDLHLRVDKRKRCGFQHCRKKLKGTVLHRGTYKLPMGLPILAVGPFGSGLFAGTENGSTAEEASVMQSVAKIYL